MQKKNENKFKSFVEKNKIVSILVALFLFIGIATPITYAYLQDSTPAVTNTFTPGKVATEIEETFDGSEKKDVKIENTENVPAYLRAAIIVNWVDADGDYAAEVPVLDEDYEIVINNTDWFEKDGYYYHKTAVDPGKSTSVLINIAKPLKEKEDYSLSIEILGSGIQAMPDQAVEETWDVQVINGQLGGGE
ncbi:hypothetical protein [Marinilactibacillus psychrotolerans]|uniref:Uncharacterized protein n=1 Tax=Marinilactibacillus psychrotolerans TaxID=191770 RepID=A0ABW8ULI3_9LACT